MLNEHSPHLRRSPEMSPLRRAHQALAAGRGGDPTGLALLEASGTDLHGLLQRRAGARCAPGRQVALHPPCGECGAAIRM